MALKWSSKFITHYYTVVFIKINFNLYSPIVFSTPDNTNANSLFTILFKDSLTEFHYDAMLAGLSFDIFTTSAGVNVSFFCKSKLFTCII